MVYYTFKTAAERWTERDESLERGGLVRDVNVNLVDSYDRNGYTPLHVAALK